jgi:hypothetical protein
MDNTRAWWDDLEVIESTGTPFEELEALSVSAELKFFIELSCVKSTSSVYLN